ncbi:ribonuclease HII [Patescibacteria group bacterium]
MMAPIRPTFREERALLTEGFSVVAGVDEAGCGCLAGPVCAAAAVLPFDSRIALVRDSKTLSEAQRERAAEMVRERAAAWSVGWATAGEVDDLNIRKAAALAMRRAVEGLELRPQFVLVDAFEIPDLGLPQRGIVRGDRHVKSIAAASVLAKTARDARLAELDREYPGYGFAKHKGYGTAAHREALRRLGPCPEHRRTYAPVRALLK